MTNSNAPAAADARYRELKGDKSVIPPGGYCYTHTGEMGRHGLPNISACPYWGIDPAKEKQDNGYCAFLKEGDWESEGLSLLWDRVKECGVSEDDNDAPPEGHAKP